MPKLEISSKRAAISKTNAQMLAISSVAAFLTVFSLVAAHSMLAQRSYLNRVIAAKEVAHVKLQKDVQAASQLGDAYKAFVSQPKNAIGGSSTGTQDNDGDNAKIILDALPSKYDFPALTSSIEKILNNNKLEVTAITGIDDEVAQQATEGSASPQAVNIPFSFTIEGASYPASQALIDTLERSIRPMQLDSLTMTGGASDMTVTVNAHTFYQPAKNFKVTTKVVK